MSNYFEVRWIENGKMREYTPECLKQGSLNQYFGAPLFYGLKYKKVNFEEYTAFDFTPTVAVLRKRLAKLHADPTPVKRVLKEWEMDGKSNEVAKALRRFADFVAFYKKQSAAGKKPFIRLLR